MVLAAVATAVAGSIRSLPMALPMSLLFSLVLRVEGLRIVRRSVAIPCPTIDAEAGSHVHPAGLDTSTAKLSQLAAAMAGGQLAFAFIWSGFP